MTGTGLGDCAMSTLACPAASKRIWQWTTRGLWCATNTCLNGWRRPPDGPAACLHRQIRPLTTKGAHAKRRLLLREDPVRGGGGTLSRNDLSLRRLPPDRRRRLGRLVQRAAGGLSVDCG